MKHVSFFFFFFFYYFAPSPKWHGDCILSRNILTSARFPQTPFWTDPACGSASLTSGGTWCKPVENIQILRYLDTYLHSDAYLIQACTKQFKANLDIGYLDIWCKPVQNILLIICLLEANLCTIFYCVFENLLLCVLGQNSTLSIICEIFMGR